MEPEGRGGKKGGERGERRERRGGEVHVLVVKVGVGVKVVEVMEVRVGKVVRAVKGEQVGAKEDGLSLASLSSPPSASSASSGLEGSKACFWAMSDRER